MKPTTVEAPGRHGEWIYRGWTSPGQADAVGPLPIEMDNDTGSSIPEGSVVVVMGDEDQIELAGSSAVPQLIGIAVDDIDDADSGMVLFDRGPVDLILTTGSVTAGQFAVPSATPGLADPVTGWTEDAFAIFTTSGTEPEGFLFGGGMTGTGTGGGAAVDDHIADTSDAHDASAISVLDAAGYFVGTDVEAVLAELGAGVRGWQDHGSAGATETISFITGHHRLVLSANLTVTFADAVSGDSYFTLVDYVGDGTIRTVGYSGSTVTWVGDALSHPGTLNEVVSVIYRTTDGGTNVIAQVAGGGSAVGALDDLSDVTITSPAEDDHIQYVGGQWVNNQRYRADVTDGFDTFVWEGDELVWEWSS